MASRSDTPRGRTPRLRRSRGGNDSSPQPARHTSALNEEVARVNSRRGTHPVTEQLSDLDSPVGSASEAPSDFTPYNRMRDVSNRSYATPYEREYRLKLIHRMLMRNAPLDQIALELGVSVDTVYRDRTELFRRLREASKKLDVHSLVGESVGFYKEVRGMSLRAASASKVPLHIRLAAMRTALIANGNMHNFLEKAGVYDVLQYRAEDASGDSDIRKFTDMLESIIDGTAETKIADNGKKQTAAKDDEGIELL